jgi:hypothetical protein
VFNNDEHIVGTTTDGVAPKLRSAQGGTRFASGKVENRPGHQADLDRNQCKTNTRKRGRRWQRRRGVAGEEGTGDEEAASISLISSPSDLISPSSRLPDPLAAGEVSSSAG